MIKHRSGNGLAPTRGTMLNAARTLPAEARVMGLYLLGASRTGKSRMLGRVIAWQDFIAGQAQVIFDPRGVTIRNFLDKLLRFLQHVPLEHHAKYWQRIRYADLSGKSGFITPLPLYYRLHPKETLAEISERYLQLILRSNPHLADAQIFGWPPLHNIGLNAGIILAGLGRQITDMQSLLTNPQDWLPLFAELEARCPEARPAVTFFRTEYLSMRPAERARLTSSLRDKIVQFSADPNLFLQFSAGVPGIDFEEIQQEGITQLVDFSQETNEEYRRFKLLWLFDYLFSWIKYRGRRGVPLCVLFDEFSAMSQKVFTGENPLSSELNSFIQEYLRNSNIWLTVAHQSVNQIDEQIRNSLLSLGTYLFGRVATMEEGRILADVIFHRNPDAVKHWRAIWGSMPHTTIGGTRYYPEVVAFEPEFFPLEEQLELGAQMLHRLGRFQFLARPAIQEGDVASGGFIPVTIAHVDRDEETGDYQYPNERQITEVVSLLAARDGIPAASLLQELNAHPPGQIDGRGERQRGQIVPQRRPERRADTKRPAPVLKPHQIKPDDGNEPPAIQPHPRHQPSQTRHQRRRQVP